jgi:hypothetical protein
MIAIPVYVAYVSFCFHPREKVLQYFVAFLAQIDPDYHTTRHPEKDGFKFVHVVYMSVGFRRDTVDKAFVGGVPQNPRVLVVASVAVYVDGFRQQSVPFLRHHVGRDWNIPTLVFWSALINESIVPTTLDTVHGRTDINEAASEGFLSVVVERMVG